MSIASASRQPALSALSFQLAVAAALATGAVPPAAAQGIALDTVEQATGLVRPVAMAAPNDGSGRLFIVQQTGEIVVRDSDGTVLETPFLDLAAEVTCCNERGFLGLAFHPDYANNGEFFVNYTRTVADQLQTVIARYTVSDADPYLADPASGDILLTFEQPTDNHNGGQLAFGPNGYLYIATGDGGPNENAQFLDTVLGKILRLDVDSTDPGLSYAIPPDNPFVDVAGARGEIWAYGLRNPWRASFDRANGDLWIGDVGQHDWEEIDFQPAASAGGENYGWDCREGTHPYDDPKDDGTSSCPSDPTAGGFIDPVLEYSHEDGRCSVTGGYRYRGDALPRLRGVYLYADLCTGEIFGTVPRCDGVIESRLLLAPPFPVSTFGEDETGEIYVSEFGNGDPPPATSKVHLLSLAPGSGGPDLVPGPDPVDFGEVEVGDTVSVVLTLTNVNSGPEAVVVASTVLSNTARFTLDPYAGDSPCRTLRPCLPPEASCTVGIDLQAEATGGIAESVTHEGNFATEIVQLTAEAVPCASEADLTLTNRTVEGAETHSACDTVTAGSGLVVTASGDLTLRAGTRVVLSDGFRVESGAMLTLEVF